MKNGIHTDANGNKQWFLNGELHREDGPAIEYTSGTKVWYLNGERHREDGPAIESEDGTFEWFLNDTQPEAWAHHRHNIVSPEGGMKLYLEFLKVLPKRPIFMGYPACFDFMFHHWYLIKYAGEDPCGFSGLDLKSYAAGKLGLDYRKSAKRNYPKNWFEKFPHDHTALTDARGQAILGINMINEKE